MALRRVQRLVTRAAHHEHADPANKHHPRRGPFLRAGGAAHQRGDTARARHHAVALPRCQRAHGSFSGTTARKGSEGKTGGDAGGVRASSEAPSVAACLFEAEKPQRVTAKLSRNGLMAFRLFAAT